MACGTRAAGLRLVLPSAILLIAAAIRLAWSAENRTLWPDEAVYLLMAKSFAGLADYEIPASRSILLPLLWSLLYRIGLGERAIRAAGIGFSLLSVHLLWRLGRRIHGDAAALGASFLLAVFWLDVFLSERFLTDGPALALWLLVLLVFVRSQLAPGGRGTLWLGPAIALLLLVRLGSAVLVPVLLLLLAIARGPSALRDSRLWISAALGALVLLPYLIWCGLRYGSPLAPLLEMDAAVSPSYAAQVTRLYPHGVRVYLEWFPALYLDPALCAVLGIGVLVAAAGLLTPRRGADRRAGAFLLAWLASTPPAFATLVGHAEARFLLPAFPAVFLLMSRGLLAVAAAASRRSPLAAAAMVALPLAWAGHQQLASTAAFMRQHSRSYWAHRVVGTWLREHASAEATIYAELAEISQYYSDRRSRWYPATRELFEEELRRSGAVYLVVERGSASQPAWLEPFLAKQALAPRFVHPRAKKPPVEVYELPTPPPSAALGSRLAPSLRLGQHGGPCRRAPALPDLRLHGTAHRGRATRWLAAFRRRRDPDRGPRAKGAARSSLLRQELEGIEEVRGRGETQA